MEFSDRPTVARIRLDHLRHNLKQLQSHVPDSQQIMAIVKANAYGHGATMVARTLENCGIKRFGVATVKEGLELRGAGLRAEIFVLDGVMAPLQDYFSNRLYPVIYELSQLKTVCDYINKDGRDATLALKFDTGMCRLGFTASQIDQIVELLSRASHVVNPLIMTHLANADLDNDSTTKRQYVLFRKIRDILKERGLKNLQFSICNSAAAIDGLFEDHHWVRPGLALYGCYPNERLKSKINLKPVLELETRIFSLKTVSPQTQIGYGGTFVTQRDSQIALLPIGYADGYPRLASNRGHVLIKGQVAPIVGRISMDLMAVDVTDIRDVNLHDLATLIGSNGDKTIRAEDVATWAETISYETLCAVSSRVPRLYEGL